MKKKKYKKKTALTSPSWFIHEIMDLHKAASMQRLRRVNERSSHIVLGRELFIFGSLTGQTASTLRQFQPSSGHQWRAVLIYFTSYLIILCLCRSVIWHASRFFFWEALSILLPPHPLGAACKTTDAQTSQDMQNISGINQSSLLTIHQF